MTIVRIRHDNRIFLRPLLLCLITLCTPFLSVPHSALAAPYLAPLLPTAVDGCPYLTEADASALLQEPVQAQAVGNLLFARGAMSPPPSAALCGYVSVAQRQAQTARPSAPHLTTQVTADHAVVVAKLLMGQQINLLPIANLFRTATPSRTTNTAGDMPPEDPVLQALLWAGNVEGTIDYLYNIAQDQPHLHASRVGALGEIAVWLWLETDDGNVAALIDGDGRDLNLIAALLGKDANEQNMLAVATRLALQMEGRLPFATQIPVETECEFLSHATAMIILNEPLPKSTDQGAGLCGYGGIAQKLVGEGPLETAALPFGIAGGVLEGDAAQQLLQRLADTLRQENPTSNDDAAATFARSLSIGDLHTARVGLYTLADPQRWHWGRAIGDHTDWITKLTDDAEHIVFLIALRPDGRVGFVVARLRRERTANGAFQRIETVNPDLIKKMPRVPLPSIPAPAPALTTTESSTNARPKPFATPAPVAYRSLSTKDGQWTQLLFDSDPITVTTAIKFNERYYVGAANDGLRVVQPAPQGGYEWYPLYANSTGLASDHVTAMAIVEGSLWVGTADAGISILNPLNNQWHTMNTQNSLLPGNTIHHINPPKLGNPPSTTGAWISTNGGVLAWNQGEARLIETGQTNSRSLNIWDADIMLNPVGYDFYFANDTGLLRGMGIPASLIPPADECLFDRVTELVVTNKRSVWLIGETKRQDGNGWQSQGLCQLSAGFLYSHWQAYTVANGRLPSDAVTALRMDETGLLWASFAATNENDSGGVAFYDGSAWQRLTPPENGLIQSPINMVHNAATQLLFSHPRIDGLTIFVPTK